ncbi:Gfo/Idh/MocA family oxidoreductase [Actinospica durhamensis]|uniref:Gfo/Idh/MocA family oxidoreductase n=1 Tax=Actinospica durhamensis TaxID=1508375 RepID=A0A941ER74_9ACTN|nr:Gfo/Idh/MocA family oxidoreductase [Actinospica durhamensis]MBR7835960.1 Gfo/Idh/MocA family oxidoreductase [Actinospica durhamensis]
MADRIRWGIAGTGGIASAFAADLALLPDAEIVAVGSRSQESADAFADRFGIPRRHVGYAALAADPEVDAIYVAVPHTGHAEATLAAIEGGKAVLCEKPFAVNARETEQMIAAARAKGTFLMEAMWVRFLPHFALVRELIAQGRIGAVRSVIADRCDILSTDPTHRIRAAELAGGALLDLGIYPVSLVSMATGGRLPARVEAVAAMTDTAVDAHASMVFQYPDGAQAVVTTALDLRSANTATIVGTEGRIVITQPWARTSPVEVIALDGTSHTTHLPHEGHGLRHQAAEVGARLRAGELESPVMPLDETLAIMRTLDLVRERIGLRYPGE